MYYNCNNSQETAPSAENNYNDRPRVHVKPRGIGPVTSLHENDVLCGRGGRINGNAGNIQFRRICGEKRQEYFAKGIKKIQKAHIAASVVERIRAMDPPGRFLKQDACTGHWYDIGCEKAMTKAGQAIREHTSAEETENQHQYAGSEQEQTITDSCSNEPLYPQYDHHQVDNNQPQQVCSLMTQNYQHPAQYCHSNNVNDTQQYDHFDHGDRNMSIALSMPTEPRLSTVSMMSGISTLLKSSVRSDLSNSKVSSRRMSGLSCLLRESILSDIHVSDCESLTGFQDNDNIGNRQLNVGEGCQASQTGLEAGFHNVPHEPCSAAVPMNAAHQESEERNYAASRGKQSRQGYARRSSIMSLSMVSTISLLSLGSATTWGAF